MNQVRVSQMSDLPDDLDIKKINPTQISQAEISNWEILTGNKFPLTFGDYFERYCVSELHEREERLKAGWKNLEWEKQYIETDMAFVKMGRDFSKMLKSINANERIKKEWDKFLMFWRLVDPDADQK